MKTKVIVVFLLSIITASQATLTTARCKLTDPGPAHVVKGAELKNDIARPPAERAGPGPPHTGELVVISLPFSSLQLSPFLVESLGLTPTQVTAIQILMDQERPKAEPLMHELQRTSSELGAAIQCRRNNNDELATQRLAARQAQLLKQLLASNLRLRQRINGVLSPRQRKEIDLFRRTSEVGGAEGN